ncbi:MAG: sensor histidine kinase, partial [Bacillota bacterium]
MIAACAYRLGECGASEAIDIIQRHQWAVIVRGGKCELLKGTGGKRCDEKPQITTEPFHNRQGDWLFIKTSIDLAEHRHTEGLIHTCREQLRSLASELSLAEERERRRIATELHDLIGQTLAVSRIKLGTLREMLSSARSVGILDEVREHIDETIRHTRSMVFELSPPALYMIGLGAALEQLAERIQEKHGLKVDFIDDGLPKPIHDETRIILFGGVRELLTNVIKHAQASSVRISLKRKSNNIVIGVKDDGIGFTIKADGSFDKGHGGFGLFSIRERLQDLGGRLKIESWPGKGTRVTLYVPVKQQ